MMLSTSFCTYKKKGKKKAEMCPEKRKRKGLNRNEYQISLFVNFKEHDDLRSCDHWNLLWWRGFLDHN